MALMLSACLEDLFNSPEEETTDTTDDSFIGKWCLVTQSVNGALSTRGTIITMNDDGTGVHQSSEDSSSFTWSTENSVLKVSPSNGDSFTATFRFGDNTVTLSYEDNGETYVEKYAKYTGERNADLIGKWTGVRSTADGADQVPAMTVTMNSDGAATAFFMDSTNIKSQEFSWTTSGNYLLNDLLCEDSDMWTGIEYTLSAPLLSGKEYYEEGYEYISIFVKDIGEKDENLAGVWNLTGLKYNGVTSPIIPQGWSFTLDATSGSGTFTQGSTVVTYSWTTNTGYLLLYPTAASQIGAGQTYTISGNTLTFSVAINAGESGYSIATYTFTKQ